MSARILIIEDNPTNMELMVYLLTAFGHTPLTAGDGASGVATARQCLPDLIISDIHLPKLDGYGVVGALKADPEVRHIPVLAVTALAMVGDRERLLAAGFDGYLGKPIEPASFVAELEAYLPRARGAGAQAAGGAMAPQPAADLPQITDPLSSLIELGIELGAERDPAALIGIGCRVAHEVCAARYACIAVFDDGGGEPARLASCGDPRAAQAAAGNPRAGVLGKLLDQRLPVRLDGIGGDPGALGLPSGHPPLHAFLGVPIASRERVHGWLYLADKLGAPGFSDVDERVAVTVSAQIAVAYENLLLYEEIRRHHAQLTADMAERIRLDEDLRRFRTAMDATADAIFLIDRSGKRFVDVNATACRMLGYEHGEFLALGGADLDGRDSERLQGLYDKLQADGHAGAMDELSVQRRDGSQVAVEVQRRTLRSGGSWILVAVARDITERKETELRLLKLAQFDTLTGLPNRSQFCSALTRTLEQAADHRWSVGVLFLDIDRFKTINDTLGHACGDELLRQFAARLGDSLRVRDTVGRFGGDEFAAIMMLPEGPQTALAVLDKIRESLRRPFDLDGHDVTVTASIGVTVYPGDGLEADTLIRYADTAMYRAKEAGRDTYRFFTAEMNAQSLARLELEGALRRAIDNEEFVLYLQPKVNIGSGRISGAEALIRWQRPGHGMVSPALFIPVLEETGLIVPVGTWVINEACRMISRWGQSGAGPVHLSVNVSGVQFFAGGLDAEVLKAVKAHDIAPELLELELTESSLMSNAEDTIAVLGNLKALGIKISIDDFGTGYSSLAYLKRFPIDKLKIDIAFVREVTSNPDDAAIVLAIINMAHSLNLQVIAEGVERDAQLAYLRRHGCDEMQGYYFSRAVPEAEFEAMLAAGKALAAPADDAQSDRPTLLIVDDDTFMLDLLSDFLAQDGYRILTAHTAAEGFDLLARNKVHVILCDQCMPAMSGTEFMERVKNLCPDTFRIMLSAYDDLTPIMAAINHGAIDRFYTKPWKGAVLRENIREGFRLHSQLHSGAGSSSLQ